VATTKPSLGLLRSLSDEHVLRELMTRPRATRAEIAAATGLSKPTVSESVRRLTAAGVVADTGERTTGRGRVGTYYALSPAAGCGLAVAIAPEGIVAEAVDLHGQTVARARAEVARAPGAGEVAGALERVAREAAMGCGGPILVAAVSAADPVDRRTGRLVELPDAPFLLGELDPPAVLAGLVDGPVVVDNDVNWAARAELRASELRDFVLLYLGEGIGCAVVTDGEVLRGHAGVAGEIAHVVTIGPDGSAMRLTDVFGTLGLRRPGSTAIDVPALLAATELRRALARAVAGVLSAAVALADPAVVLVGGPWGGEPEILEAVASELAAAPRSVPVAAAASPPLAGARGAAIDRLRDAIVAQTSAATPS
jgi:predicted NBD/HSP70 family sugar kinase